MWYIWNPKTNTGTVRGPQKTRPRERATAVVTDSWPEHDGPPSTADARDWDDWRMRRGYTGDR